LSEHRYWLGLSLISGIGPKRLTQLAAVFDAMADAWHADERKLRSAGVESAAVSAIVQGRSAIDLDSEVDKVRKAGVTLVTIMDPAYPELLKEVEDAPALIYVRGSLTEADSRALGVVGTRKATRYGEDAAYHLARHLVQHDVTVVSGLAQGIDAAAHRGALAGNGRTIAVMGCGLDIVYPRSHADLARRITNNGALISEFPLGTEPVAANFPRRNRIISGMSLGLMVVEAPRGSGALITAGYAAEQGREVFAVPGNIFNPMSIGANQLIQDGAKLVCSVEDILSELSIAYDNRHVKVRAEKIMPSNETEARLLSFLQADPIHIDDLVRLSGMQVAEVSSVLTMLELKGLAQTVGRMQYALARHDI
jgi:DNA processing protein